MLRVGPATDFHLTFDSVTVGLGPMSTHRLGGSDTYVEQSLAISLTAGVSRQVANARTLSGVIGDLAFTVPSKAIASIRAVYVAAVCGVSPQ